MSNTPYNCQSCTPLPPNTCLGALGVIGGLRCVLHQLLVRRAIQGVKLVHDYAWDAWDAVSRALPAGIPLVFMSWFGCL